MKILIAGLGSIGRRHLHNLVALGEETSCSIAHIAAHYQTKNWLDAR
jgi:Trk K+ transport system NAD-binding subunit